MRFVVLALVVVSLSGCLGVSAAMLLASGVTAIGTGVSALHDCHEDGGCKSLPLPP